eukprot:TRINITY_DN38024_c0_g1_i1.p1 TRINITY_DN38024_c0_g1~~TRINITY_DN38024_c0_g1_i1.p1  ORF type:complete len:212 (-),score=36.36 TRINITY_DN38024_c0_g1_i1:157-792(-)
MEEDEEDEEGDLAALALLRASGAAPSSHTVSPALEFAKYLCHVLSLDERFQHDTMLLRRSIMKMLHVREFSSDASFTNPCISFSLPTTVCTFCNHTRSLDLCRDPELLAHNWNCPSCQQPYNKGQIEMTLVDIVCRKNERYQLQDLKCKNCHLPKADSMRSRCACSGEYGETKSAQELLQSMKVIHGIALYHNLPWLQETVEWLLPQATAE